MPTEIRHFINGRLVAGKSGRFAPVFNPATGQETDRVPLAGAEEMAEAVAAARAAFPKWASTTPLRRARVLNRFLRLLEENEERTAEVITAEHGKVLSDAQGEIARGIEVVEFATGAPHLLKGEITENVGTRVSASTRSKFATTSRRSRPRTREIRPRPAPLPILTGEPTSPSVRSAGECNFSSARGA